MNTNETKTETALEASPSPLSLITPENIIERAICQDPDWIQGAMWGKPRRGHPEGKVAYHIRDVLANVDEMKGLAPGHRLELRLIALIHDTFKYQVDKTKPRSGENHHGHLAMRFAQKYIPGRGDLLEIIRLHDEAYNAYMVGARDPKKPRWKKAQTRLDRLIESLDDADASIALYLAFYRADNNTDGKSQDCLEWFVKYLDQIHVENKS